MGVSGCRQRGSNPLYDSADAHKIRVFEVEKAKSNKKVTRIVTQSTPYMIKKGDAPPDGLVTIKCIFKIRNN